MATVAGSFIDCCSAASVATNMTAVYDGTQYCYTATMWTTSTAVNQMVLVSTTLVKPDYIYCSKWDSFGGSTNNLVTLVALEYFKYS